MRALQELPLQEAPVTTAMTGPLITLCLGRARVRSKRGASPCVVVEPGCEASGL
jgi:hypothetical protein